MNVKIATTCTPSRAHHHSAFPSQPSQPSQVSQPTAAWRDVMLTGEDVREMRRRIGLSQAELGRRLGYSRAAINQWERNAREIPIAQMKRIIDTISEVAIEHEALRRAVAQLRGGGGVD